MNGENNEQTEKLPDQIENSKVAEIIPDTPTMAQTYVQGLPITTVDIPKTILQSPKETLSHLTLAARGDGADCEAIFEVTNGLPKVETQQTVSQTTNEALILSGDEDVSLHQGKFEFCINDLTVDAKGNIRSNMA